jgi:hypothetical protein
VPQDVLEAAVADDRRGRVARDALGGPVPEPDRAPAVDEVDALGELVEHLAE